MTETLERVGRQLFGGPLCERRQGGKLAAQSLDRRDHAGEAFVLDPATQEDGLGGNSDGAHIPSDAGNRVERLFDRAAVGDAESGVDPLQEFFVRPSELEQNHLGKVGFAAAAADEPGDVEIVCGNGRRSRQDACVRSRHHVREIDPHGAGLNAYDQPAKL